MFGIDLTGKNAIVTGAAGSIGKACAEALARAGANVAVTGRRDNVFGIVDDVAAFGTKVKAYIMDVSKEDEVFSVFDQVASEFGSVDILVSNAGIVGDKGLLGDTPIEDAKKIFSVNVYGTNICIRAALKYMRPQKYGRIVVISSVSSRRGFPGSDNYAASKAAVRSLIQSTGAGYAKEGITCNGICPGFVYSNIWERHFAKEAEEKGCTPYELFEQMAAPMCANGRVQTPEDMGATAAFLASDLAINITGQSINVCGGFVFN